jgi:hypothetical protein
MCVPPSDNFINAATILPLSPQRRGSGDDNHRLLGIYEGGKAVLLACYYAAPGRIETLLDHMPAARPMSANGSGAARGEDEITVATAQVSAPTSPENPPRTSP